MSSQTSFDLLSDLSGMHAIGLSEGNLTKREKELIALAASLATGFEEGMAYHIHNALEAGATVDEIREALEVAVVVQAEPTVMAGINAARSLEQEGSYAAAASTD